MSSYVTFSLCLFHLKFIFSLLASQFQFILKFFWEIHIDVGYIKLVQIYLECKAFYTAMATYVFELLNLQPQSRLKNGVLVAIQLFF